MHAIINNKLPTKRNVKPLLGTVQGTGKYVL